ncbi:bifunctional phosphatase PAP2/diacylglycerol kinase family protein [Microbacterium esteraromaticum]|uniref:bifunctional phosphatase PAP2/diacylglycerol kinase family protein n=1 Tax=Microbacterium esteraromaticum TaxID=57043 RepID=UPI0019591D8F|nr:bifunctional phosphatase PAP2/diacylglycerol kinase family protein [Microbacterium esteraromaticum]MBM7464499.1 undecaprenyl-diphosphatase [Microbacterium esteraromaticum]
MRNFGTEGDRQVASHRTSLLKRGVASLTRPSVALRRVRLLPRWVRRLDSRAAQRINGHRHLPELDGALARLSHRADRSRLWFQIGTLLYLMGGAPRRGAVRGIGSLIVGSALANLVGKRVFGGDRPLLKDVPVPRRLRKTPTSGSFPSGHSASAAAFVTGVALESGRSGAVLAPLGAAVAYSRLHTGAHWLSDVIGGGALGAAVAVLGRMLVPAHPRPEPTHRGAMVELAALPDGAGALIFANPASGIDPLRPEPASFLAKELPSAEVHLLADGDDIAHLVRDAVASDDPPHVIGVWGGDGTVANTADAARRAHLPLVIFPGGTFNHFARTAGAATLDDAVQALKTGAGRRVDVAELAIDGGRPMTVMNVASVGVYPGFVAEREEMEGALGKPVATLIAAIRVLAWARTLSVRVDGRTARVWSVAVAAGQNSSASMVPLQRRRLDDGVLDVRVLHARGRMPRLRGLVALTFGVRASALLDRVPGRAELATIEAFTAQEVRIEARTSSGEPVHIAHDGEVSALDGGTAVATVRIVPGGLEVYGLADEDG